MVGSIDKVFPQHTPLTNSTTGS